MMGIFFLPDLSSSPAPIPLEPKLPGLVDTLCPRCAGSGFEEYVTVGGDDVTEACPECLESGVITVCSACGHAPGMENGFEVCGCRFQGLELKSRDLTAPEKALEIQAAKGYGWL